MEYGILHFITLHRGNNLKCIIILLINLTPDTCWCTLLKTKIYTSILKTALQLNNTLPSEHLHTYALYLKKGVTLMYLSVCDYTLHYRVTEVWEAGLVNTAGAQHTHSYTLIALFCLCGRIRRGMTLQTRSNRGVNIPSVCKCLVKSSIMINELQDELCCFPAQMV